MTSRYPDGSTNPNWHENRVVIPRKTRLGTIDSKHIEAIVCHRLNAYTAEEYLVKWKTKPITAESTSSPIPHSWHNLQELARSLPELQTYIEDFRRHRPYHNPLKRKTPSDVGDEDDNDDRPTNSIKSTGILRSLGSSLATSQQEYNGSLTYIEGTITMRRDGRNRYAYTLPTASMLEAASRVDTRQAAYDIRTEYEKRLAKVSGPRITVCNALDESTPTLDFRFISDHVLGKNVEALDDATVIGCGSAHDPSGCRPHMGQYMGCEYSQKCACLEFAAIDTARLNESDRWKLHNNELMGLPKRFPYHSPNSKTRAYCLVDFYLKSRRQIYECNPRCNCGSKCKTRLVQKGRTIPVEIFKTETRGWGLRTLVDLKKGQFIDTYRGEVITNKEADERSEHAGHGKASYQYSLDKHIGEHLQEDECYVVDGEMMGGPTRFMNHSCDPNCRQYTVSYNKYDFRVYQLAFFAYKNIEQGTELTFDYLDKDEEEEGENQAKGSERSDGDDHMICRCGSEKCRGTLWM